ncbi:hypothetical protein N7533_013155 [Penicillium manginii]|uniref:uncharacterized protein n=1 Tax=Penicillium manginii TaxID=203109 RepID=UPI002548F9A8|nr:uncharacterized protein N7533_013155 [Penicillium manginii]KAJ5734752.1 hypothetical protein N7533_013155 [Penicillium manginii]
MRNLGTALIALASLLATPGTCANQPPGKNAILLSNVQALTLRANRDTTSRRVSAAPQLKCIGHEKICALYEIETMRCKNEGYDYDEEDIQWTCTAPLPSEFKLGSTDVICEGYRNSDDPWVLKGSCGVEYRMLLTDEGEERFGKEVYRSGSVTKKDTVTVIFWVLFIGVLVFIVAAACRSDTPVAREQRRRRWGWGGGGGGGGDDGYYPPPPPYSSSDCSSGQSQGWRPGFWSGLGAGGAAGYQMGRNSARGSQRDSSRYNDPGEGSSRRSATPSFSTTTTGTGFGSTRRR